MLEFFLKLESDFFLNYEEYQILLGIFTETITNRTLAVNSFGFN
jgi:hypothetical protein